MNTREIKFRAWDKEKKRMIIQDGEWIFDSEYDDLCLHFPTCGCGGIERYELMQFTGLKDKNGKEIWEGDIVKFGIARFKNKKEEIEWRVGWIVYQEDYMGFKIEDEEMFWDYDEGGYGNDDVSSVKVIGNIYENSELLEDKK